MFAPVFRFRTTTLYVWYRKIPVESMLSRGTRVITGISYTCGMSATAQGSWYVYNGGPTSLAPGATGAYRCIEEGGGMFSVYVKLTGTNATNSPFAVSF